MDLYEYQAKDVFAAHGVPVLPGRTVDTAAEAERAAQEIGTAVVVKAQVKTGGRGKAGGVKLAKDPAERPQSAREMIAANPEIAALVLGAAASGPPGPMVSHFTGADAGGMSVPVMIIPGSLTPEAIDRLS